MEDARIEMSDFYVVVDVLYRAAVDFFLRFFRLLLVMGLCRGRCYS